MTTFSDMTEELRLKQELEERVAQFNALLDHLPVGVAYFDDQGVCRAANDPAAPAAGAVAVASSPGRRPTTLFAGAESGSALAEAVCRCAAEQAPHAESAIPWRDAARPRAPAAGLAVRAPAAGLRPASGRAGADRRRLGPRPRRGRPPRRRRRGRAGLAEQDPVPLGRQPRPAHAGQRPGPAGRAARRGWSTTREPADEDLAHLAGDLRQAAGNLIELINDLLDLTRFDSGQSSITRPISRWTDWLASTLGAAGRRGAGKGLDFAWRVDGPGSGRAGRPGQARPGAGQPGGQRA